MNYHCFLPFTQILIPFSPHHLRCQLLKERRYCLSKVVASSSRGAGPRPSRPPLLVAVQCSKNVFTLDKASTGNGWMEKYMK